MAVKFLVLYAIVFLFALVPTLLFGAWLRRQSWDLKEKISAWDPFIKVMAIAGAVIVGLATFERFLDQREQEFLKLEIDGSQAKAAVFVQAINSASTIANAKSLEGAQEKEAVDTFWRLYWGELGQIEGPTVEGAMVNFGRAIQDWQGSGAKPADIEQLSYKLALACGEEQKPLRAEVKRLRQRYLPSSGIALP